MKVYGKILLDYTDALERKDEKALSIIRALAKVDPDLLRLLTIIDASFRQREVYEEQKAMLQQVFSDIVE